ncbi:MAG: DNA polymerase III subunit delta' [Campylobacterales bacterium]|nr:DNA polymerase III subunit delta' [Campylobacterales bacterium]
MQLISQVIITENIDETLLALEAQKKDEIIHKIVKEDNFAIEDAKLAIEKAYIANIQTTVIIMASKSFSNIVQNKLLKVIEEPPKNSEFIIVTNQKSSILPTIKSRIPVNTHKTATKESQRYIDVDTLSLGSVYEFLKANQRIKASEAKEMLQSILNDAFKSGYYDFDHGSLKLFEEAVTVLGFGGVRSEFVLHTVLLKMLAKKRRQKDMGQRV